MRRRLPLVLGLALTGCAEASTPPGAPGVPRAGPATDEPMLVIEASVAGDALAPGPETGYYLVIDTDGDPADGPRINGPAPQQHPYPDPRAYLPFVRDEQAFLDREPIPVPDSSWDTYFVLTEEAGQPVVWQGRRRPDGTVDERVRQLRRGDEWEIVGGKNWRLNVPFDQLNPAGTPTPSQWEANLATARIGSFERSDQALIDRWGQGQGAYFPILTRPGVQSHYDSVGGVASPQNLPTGAEAGAYDWTMVTTRVLELGGAPASGSAF